MQKAIVCFFVAALTSAPALAQTARVVHPLMFDLNVGMEGPPPAIDTTTSQIASTYDSRSALVHEEFSELGSNHGFTSELFTTLLKPLSRSISVQ